ncbi:Single-stranded DNA-binding protein, mitochondrial [Portunus trituberculatus]|uniref:Single-stranded DNA-binding protein, mitochondrial n=1 Tax=Portunus trituberculatus TaxID=210409 RepID=A0A5B7GCZ0_PORTR|nr:Single-stranded DNA-binding protein, mitochondrial [Portunus trituberculatus]
MFFIYLFIIYYLFIYFFFLRRIAPVGSLEECVRSAVQLPPISGAGNFIYSGTHIKAHITTQAHLGSNHLEPGYHGNMQVTLNYSTNGKVFKVVRGGIRTYAWTSACSHTHHLIHYATASLCKCSGVVDKMVSMGSGSHPHIGSNPTTYRFEAMSFVEWFKVTCHHDTQVLALNQVMLLGRVGGAPEKRGTEEHPVVTFSVATHTNYRKGDDLIQQTDWHRIAVFKPFLRESVYRYLTRGQRVMVQGRIGYLERRDPENNQLIMKTATIVAEDWLAHQL